MCGSHMSSSSLSLCHRHTRPWQGGGGAHWTESHSIAAAMAGRHACGGGAHWMGRAARVAREPHGHGRTGAVMHLYGGSKPRQGSGTWGCCAVVCPRGQQAASGQGKAGMPGGSPRWWCEGSPEIGGDGGGGPRKMQHVGGGRIRRWLPGEDRRRHPRGAPCTGVVWPRVLSSICRMKKTKGILGSGRRNLLSQ